MPKPIVEKLRVDLLKALDSGDTKKRLFDQAIDLKTATPEQFVEHVKAETARWTKVGARPTSRRSEGTRDALELARKLRGAARAQPTAARTVLRSTSPARPWTRATSESRSVARDARTRNAGERCRTGLDFPYLPRAHRYTALDLTGAMLKRALSRAHGLEIAWTRGDSQALPFRDDAFDYVVLHLIIAVVPRPDRALTEAARVAKPGGTLIVFDKFLAPDDARRCGAC